MHLAGAFDYHVHKEGLRNEPRSVLCIRLHPLLAVFWPSDGYGYSKF